MNIDAILIFEHDRVENFYPFAVMHPVWELRCGALRLFEKVAMQFPDKKIIYQGREGQLKSFLKRFDNEYDLIDRQEIGKEDTFVLLANVLTNKKLWQQIESGYDKFCAANGGRKAVVFTYNNMTFGAFIPKEEMINPVESDKNFLPRFLTEFNSSFPNVEVGDVSIINYLWDAIEYNAQAIVDDVEYLQHSHGLLDTRIFTRVTAGDIHSIFAGRDCSISNGVYLDSSKGPIIIGNNVEIMANSVITGPCFIGDHTVIKIGAKIYEANSFGEHCKVGGEVENSIIQSYSNKQHEGFLGHSYLGEWVNIGADTNTSDLKNTYGNVKVSIGGYEIDTGRMFLGFLCGDHTKTAINTTLNTGTIAGICGILVADGFLPNSIPSFAWRGTKGCSLYKAGKAIEVARIVMARRGKELLPEEEELMIGEYDKTKEAMG